MFSLSFVSKKFLVSLVVQLVSRVDAAAAKSLQSCPTLCDPIQFRRSVVSDSLLPLGLQGDRTSPF